MNNQQIRVQKKSNRETILQLIDVQQSYVIGNEPLHILKGVDLSLQSREIVGIVGPSGCGKSSLLHIAGLLEASQSGEILIKNQNCMVLSEREKTQIRRHKIGFIYQFHHLLPEFTAHENIILPQLVAGHSRKQSSERAEYLLKGLELQDRMAHRPGQLSGGERQRVAIARALANKPDLLLADEPTGNLDPKTSDFVLQSLVRLTNEENVTILMATHNHTHIPYMHRVLTLKSGQIQKYEK